MTTKSYHLTSEAVEELLKFVEALQETSVTDTFEERYQNVLDELGELVNNRLDNEDAQTLWQIYYDLAGFINGIIRKLSGFSE